MISVVVPTYNRADVLPKTVDSIINQNFSDWEIIIVDDCSTDNTNSLVKEKYNDSRIKYIKLENNSGVHVARNRGLEESKGDLILFLDSDDTVYPNMMEIFYEIFQAKPDIGVVSAANMTDTGELTGLDVPQSRIIEFREVLCGEHQRPLKMGIIMMRRSVIGDIRFVEQNLDFIFYRRVIKHTKFYYINEPLGTYHVQLSSLGEKAKDSLTFKRRKANANLSIRRARELDKFLEEFKDDFFEHCPYRYGKYAYGAAVGLLLDGQKKKAINYAWRSYRYTRRINYLVLFCLSIIPFSRGLLKILFKIKSK